VGASSGVLRPPGLERIEEVRAVVLCLCFIPPVCYLNGLIWWEFNPCSSIHVDMQATLWGLLSWSSGIVVHPSLRYYGHRGLAPYGFAVLAD
jgi:hypothetical protein